MTSKRDTASISEVDMGLSQGISSTVSGVRARKVKRAKPAHGEALGILNPYGDIWTHDTFHSEAAARAYVRAFWANIPALGADLDKFTVVRVKVTVSAIADTTPAEELPGRPQDKADQ